MKCNMKTMLKTGLILAAFVIVAYVALPDSRQLILALTPVAFFLICPLMMFFMMKSMHSHNETDRIDQRETKLVPLSAIPETVDQRRDERVTL